MAVSLDNTQVSFIRLNERPGLGEIDSPGRVRKKNGLNSNEAARKYFAAMPGVSFGGRLQIRVVDPAVIGTSFAISEVPVPATLIKTLS